MESTRILIFLLALICVTNALSNIENTNAKKEEEILLRQIYADMDKGVKNLIRENIKSVLRVVEEKSQELNVSTKCKGNAFKLLSGLRDLKFWALNFIDATGKPSSGIMGGNVYMYGNYDQCLNSSVFKRSGDVDFRGRYCLVSVAPHLPEPALTPDFRERLALVKNITQNLTEIIGTFAHMSEVYRTSHAKIGLCVPSGCDTNDVDKFIKYVGKQILLNLTLDFCHTEDTLIYFTPLRIVILFIYSCFNLLVIISSVIERYSTARKIKFQNPVMRSLLCFSLPYNFQKFTSTQVTEGNLSCLNGIRVLTLFYVILGHHYILKLGLSMHRNVLFKVMLTWAPRFFFQILVNGTFSVDVFFFIGGFLNCYLRAKKNLTFFSLSSSFMILFHRLMRIYPVYIFIILLSLLFNLRGPAAHDIMKSYWEPCRTQWWKNIIFINNLYDIDYQCVPHSWYLAADMQLFVVSLFTIPLLFRKPKIGVFVNLAIILFSTAFSSIQVWTRNIFPTILLTVDLAQEEIENMTDVYFKPFAHSSAYFGGVLLGFYITKKRSLTLSKITLVLGWIIASTMFLTMLFITKRWNSGIPYTRLESALYTSLSRLIYSWCVGWLIFCCFAGNGGFINYILSWKVWIPLNRLCLCAYLLSAIIQMYYFGNLRTTQDFQHEIEIWGYFGDITITCLLAVPMVLLFESPFIALEKVIFHKKENSSELKGNEMNGKQIIKNENDTKSDKDKISIKL